MKSNTTILATLLLLITLSSSGCMYMSGIKGNGNVVKETREVSSFDGIKVGGAFNVYLTQSNTESLTIEADENLLKIIETRVRGNTLVISTKENIRGSEELNIFITFKDIDKLDISGACDLESEGMLKFSTLKLEASGASEIDLQLTTSKLSCDFSGASDIEFSGKVKECDIEISGAAELKAFDLETEEMELRVSGAADAKVNASKYLKVNASGAASVQYVGNPNIDQHTSGASSIRKR